MGGSSTKKEKIAHTMPFGSDPRSLANDNKDTPKSSGKFWISCAFYHIWILHYPHVAEPLYGLLKKRNKFEWQEEHTNAIRKLKKLLLEAPTLRKADYTEGKLIYVTVDTSGTRIGWVIYQEGEDSPHYAIRFGAKVLSERQ